VASKGSQGVHVGSSPGREGHVGAVHAAVEDIGGETVTLRIRWERLDGVPIPVTLKHAVAAGIIDEEGSTLAWLVHQYEVVPGGVRMLSTFRMPAVLSGEFAEHLRRHCQEEMANLPKFLPEIYRKSKPASKTRNTD